MRTALIYNFLIEANLMASIAIVLLMLLRRFLRRQLGNSALCFGWLLVAIRLLLPLSLPNPLINAIRSPFAADLAIRPIAGQVKVRLSDAIRAAGFWMYRANLRAASDAANRLEWQMQDATLPILLAKVYIAGAALVCAWFVFCNVRFRLKLRAGRIEPISGKLLQQYTALCAQRGVKPVPVYFTDPLPSACLVGVFRPYIALPLTAAPQDAIHVLTHEVCHLRNGDHLWGVLRLACCALHWFNPLVWMAASMSRTDGELRCDDQVIRPMQYEEKKAYANVLVLAAARRNAPGMGVLATGMTMTGKRLKTRVVTILGEGRPWRWLTVSFVVLASMCLAGAFATGEVRTVPRILRSHPVLNRQEIKNEQDARAYARRVWEMDDLGGPEKEPLSWEIETALDGSGDCLAAAYGSGERYLGEIRFDRDGNVLAAIRPNSALPEGELLATELTLSEKEQEELANDLIAFIEAINPAVAKRAAACQFIQEGWQDEFRVVDVAFWSSDKGMERNDDVTAYFTVQIAPKVRILTYNIYYGAAGGNG